MPGLSKQEKRLAKKALQPVPVIKEREARAHFLWVPGLIGRIQSAARYPLTSYGAILLLQLKIVWGMWWYKDISTGDTTQYFLRAVNWFETGRTEFLWSPMYTTFYGTLLHWSTDPYVVTTLHRLVIVFASAALVLALMRCFLPPGIAWMAAAWWAVLPINFNALYEVHLFAAIPLLCALLAILWIPGRWGRGTGAAILLLTAALMRNEYFVAAALFILLSYGWELLYSGWRTVDFRKMWLPYGLPLLIAGVLILVLFLRSSPPADLASLRAKQTVNVCQVYAAGYQQRASDFQGSIWTECDQLMNRVFGATDLTFLEAARRNPRAMLGHVLWNIDLTPSGLQVLLFNVRSGSANPDYASTYQSNLVLIPTLLAVATVIAGLILLFREREQWRAEWTEQRLWASIAMGCMAVSVCAALLSNRPRPSYMFILGIELRVVIAYCFYVIVSRMPTVRRVGTWVSAVLVAIVVLAPSIYVLQPSFRPVLRAIQRVRPAAPAFTEPHPMLVSEEFGTELTAYLGRCDCPYVRFDQLRRGMDSGTSLAEALDRTGANLFYANELILTDPEALQFVKNAGSYHWRVIADGHRGGENWAVLRRIPKH